MILVISNIIFIIYIFVTGKDVLEPPQIVVNCDRGFRSFKGLGSISGTYCAIAHDNKDVFGSGNGYDNVAADITHMEIKAIERGYKIVSDFRESGDSDAEIMSHKPKCC